MNFWSLNNVFYFSKNYEKEEFQKKVGNEYKRFHNYLYWKVIKADQDKEKVHQDIVSELEVMIKKYSSNDSEEFSRNYYPNSVGQDLFKTNYV